ncbi:MAG: hypothetical protein ACK46Q_01935 [Hyphomonas sp.]
MPRAIPAAILTGLAMLLAGCASDLAQGYRSTPNYPAYASASCSGVAASEAVNQFSARHIEHVTGYKADTRRPSRSDLRGGLLMALVFAAADSRPVAAEDVCAGVAAAQSSAARRRGY